MIDFEIRLFPVNRGKKLKARANVTFKIEDDISIDIKGFRVVDDGAKKPWVAVPTESYMDNGVQKYKEICWLSERLMAIVAKKTLEKYKQMNGKT